jgi:hypothetical protein
MWLRITIALETLISITLAQTTLDLNTIPLVTRNQWCAAQGTTCGLLYSGATSLNTCNATSLAYDYTYASDNLTPSLDVFMETIPTFICKAIFSGYVSEAAGN